MALLLAAMGAILEVKACCCACVMGAVETAADNSGAAPKEPVPNKPASGAKDPITC